MYKSYKKEVSVENTRPSFKTAEPGSITSPAHVKTATEGKSEHDDTINECWRRIDQQLEKRKKQSPGRRKKDRGWKIIRVFVSSTFNDYHNEREELVKKVFPDLSEWLRSRQMVLVECDLRWGVPANSDADTTVAACLEEIERCMEDNDGQPFFINLTGERYGWIPGVSDLSDGIEQRYDWIPNLSITAMEIVRGAILPRSSNAAFFMRHVKGDIPSSEQSKFIDTDSLQVAHLERHKRELEKRFPDQVFHYVAKVKGVEEDSCGRNKLVFDSLTELACCCFQLVFDSLTELATQVTRFLHRAVERSYPTRLDEVVMTPEEKETQAHWYFLTDKCSQFEGRQGDLEKAINFANGNGGGGQVMVVSAEEGYGKSTLMAELTRTLVEAEDQDVFYHFVGKDGTSAHVTNLFKRLNHHLSQDGDGACSDDGEYAELERAWLEKLERLGTTSRNKRLVIIIDAVNELDNAGSTSALSWLPQQLPANVVLLLSFVTSHAPTAARLQHVTSDVTNVVTLTAFDQQTSETMCTNYFKNYAKTLDDDQLASLLGNPGASHPLWLRTACDEIRVYGDFATLTQKIRNLGEDIFTLLTNILDRLLAEDAEQMVEKTLCLLGCAADGLGERGLTSLLSDTSQPLPPVVWAQTRHKLSAFIRYRLDGNVVWSLAHAVVKRVVHKRLLNDNQTVKKYNKILANYYDGLVHGKGGSYPGQQFDRSNLSNLQRHLVVAGETQRLLDFYWGDRLSMMVPNIERRQLVEKLRCPMQNTQNSASPKYCNFCRHKVDRKCFFCGQFPADRPALWCQRHQPMTKSQKSCLICTKVFPDNLLQDLKLCSHCSVHGKCCHIRTNDRSLENQVIASWRASFY